MFSIFTGATIPVDIVFRPFSRLTGEYTEAGISVALGGSIKFHAPGHCSRLSTRCGSNHSTSWQVQTHGQTYTQISDKINDLEDFF
jgi:hypothetical protein